MRVCSKQQLHTLKQKKKKQPTLRKWSKIGWSPEYTMDAISCITGNISPELILACSRNGSLADHTNLHHPVTGGIWFPLETGRGALHSDIMEEDALGILQKNRWDGFYNFSENVQIFFE